MAKYNVGDKVMMGLFGWPAKAAEVTHSDGRWVTVDGQMFDAETGRMRGDRWGGWLRTPDEHAAVERRKDCKRRLRDHGAALPDRLSIGQFERILAILEEEGGE